jgi:ABC-type multidrug transport system fused ATPase/permease subunit
VSISLLILRLWSHINPSRRIQFVLLLGLMLIASLAEVMTLGAVVPFLGILISPETLFSSPLGGFLSEFVDTEDKVGAMQFITFIFVIFAACAGVIRILLLWFSTRISFAVGADISRLVFEKHLNLPYDVHVDANSSDVINGIIQRVNGVVFWVILPCLTLVTSFLLLVFITGALILLDPYVACVTIFGFGMLYAMITMATKKGLQVNGKVINEEQTEVIKTLQEGLGGIRDVIISDLQNHYKRRYRKADSKLRFAQGTNNFIGGFPRPAMESLGMSFIAILALYLSGQAEGIKYYLPILGALAVGAQRVLPALQQSYAAIANIIGGKEVLLETVKILEVNPVEITNSPSSDFAFKSRVVFENICFHHRRSQKMILKDVNFCVEKGQRIGLIGRTGEGKSTLSDLFMGLLFPTSGRILVDEQELNIGNQRDWHSQIAHVPQHIFLADSTILENIAFGLSIDEINMEKVASVAKVSLVSEFLAAGNFDLTTTVGERGIRLSGGQRQRIGLARALYKNASVLVLDEATSALDDLSEKKIIKNIEALNPEKTIFMIAHRTSTLENCDRIFRIENGRITDVGSYNDLQREVKSH